MVTRLTASACPTAVTDSPSMTNTTVNPATNPPAVRSTRPGRDRPPSRMVAASSPVITDRYAGTSGSTQGDANDTTPPVKAASSPVPPSIARPTSESVGHSLRSSLAKHTPMGILLPHGRRWKVAQVSVEPVRGVVGPGVGPGMDPARPRRGRWGGPLGRLLEWPRRRWVTAAVALPGLTLAFGFAGHRAGVALPAWTWPVAVGLAVVGALIVASYVPAPGTGVRLEVGCTPCAVVAAGAVVMALIFRSGAPADPARALLGAAVLALGLHQRLTDPDRCPAQVPASAGRPAPGGGPGAADPPEQ